MLALAQPPVITAIGAGIHHSDEPSDFCLAGRWRMHLYSTPVTMRAEGQAWDIPAGWAGLWPPESQLDCRFRGRSVHICAHFQIADAPRTVAVPALQDLGDRFAAIDEAFQEAVRWFAHAPHRSEARLWDLLWQLADQAALAPPPSRHPALERARAFVQAHLNQDLPVERIAEAAGCSADHLLRVFRRELGVTTVAYVRSSRVQRAEYLLKHSRIPIKEIAAEVGIPDLHFFNKVVRAELGKPPTKVRSGG
jgi:transcriptional regulator GlxA family with amidase domain